MDRHGAIRLARNSTNLPKEAIVGVLERKSVDRFRRRVNCECQFLACSLCFATRRNLCATNRVCANFILSNIFFVFPKLSGKGGEKLSWQTCCNLVLCRDQWVKQVHKPKTNNAANDHANPLHGCQLLPQKAEKHQKLSPRFLRKKRGLSKTRF